MKKKQLIVLSENEILTFHRKVKFDQSEIYIFDIIYHQRCR